jgi:hypothetical protein
MNMISAVKEIELTNITGIRLKGFVVLSQNAQET